MNDRFAWYSFLVSVIVMVDRVAKFLVMHYAVHECTINSLLSFRLIVNRGIAFGLFNQTNQFTFLSLTFIIAVFTSVLGRYVMTMLHQRTNLIGEFCILAGAFSNIIDRIIYGGVIDFIAVRIGQYQFPIFNGADMAIVFGALLMMYKHMRSL